MTFRTEVFLPYINAIGAALNWDVHHRSLFRKLSVNDVACYAVVCDDTLGGRAEGARKFCPFLGALPLVGMQFSAAL